MVDGSKHEGRVGSERVQVVADGLIKLTTVGTLDDVVNTTDILRRKDSHKVARAAHRLQLVEQRERTDHRIRRPEVLPTDERADVAVVPIRGRPHRPDAADGQHQCHHHEQQAPPTASCCHRRGGHQQREECHPAIVRGETACQHHGDRRCECEQQGQESLGAHESAQATAETSGIGQRRDDSQHDEAAIVSEGGKLPAKICRRAQLLQLLDIRHVLESEHLACPGKHRQGDRRERSRIRHYAAGKCQQSAVGKHETAQEYHPQHEARQHQASEGGYLPAAVFHHDKKEQAEGTQAGSGLKARPHGESRDCSNGEACRRRLRFQVALHGLDCKNEH